MTSRAKVKLRPDWPRGRLKEFAEIFAVAVAGFAILDNHLHLQERLHPDVAKGCSDEDVVRRWGRLFPPRDKARQTVAVSDGWIQARLKNAAWVAMTRQRLSISRGWRKGDPDFSAARKWMSLLSCLRPASTAINRT